MGRVDRVGAVAYSIPAGRQAASLVVGGSGGDVEVLEVGSCNNVALGSHGDGVAGAAGVANAAHGVNTYNVLRRGGEASDGGGVRADGSGVGDAVGGVGDEPVGGRGGHIGPVDGYAGLRSTGGYHVAHAGAGGDVVKRDVVDIGIPRRGGTVGLDGYILAVAGVGAERELVLGPYNAAVEGEGVETHKGGGSVGVGHDADFEHGVVACRRGAGPEAELQGVDVGAVVHRRQRDNLVVAVGGGSGAAIPVEALVAVVGVVVGGRTCYIGISKVGGAVVQAGPAGGERSRGGAAGGLGLKVLSVGHRDGAADGAEEVAGPVAGVAGAADGAHADGVGGRCSKVGERHAGGVDHYGCVVVKLVLPLGGAARFGPHDGGAVLADGRGAEAANLGARGEVVEGDVVNIGIPGRSGTVGLDGDVLAVAVIGCQRHFNLSPSGAGGHGDGVNAHKAGGVGGVGHNAYLENRNVAGRGSAGPEVELEAAGVGAVVNRRQSDNLVVAVGAGGGAGIPVQALGTTGGVVVGGRRADIRIAEVGGAVVEVSPAGCKGSAGAGCGSLVLEVLSVGQGNRAAHGAEGVALPVAGVAAAAEGAYTDGVGSAGGKVCQGGAGGGNHYGRVIVKLVFPLGGAARLGPHDGGAVLANRGGGDAADLRTGG